MRVDLFDFDLPPALIADRPAVPRDSARLLEVAESLHDHVVRDLPALLRPGDLLVFNDTRVIPARLFGRRGAAGVEVTLHKGVAADRWRAFARPARKLKPGNVIAFDGGLSATVAEKGEGGEIELAFDRGGANLMAALTEVGRMPLPRYIKRTGGADERDAPTTRRSSRPRMAPWRRPPPGSISRRRYWRLWRRAGSRGSPSPCMSAPAPSCP